MVVVSPLAAKSQTKKKAWTIISWIGTFSVLFNLWVLFFFEIRTDESKKFCDVHKTWENEYFIMAVIYIGLTVGLPILIIFVSNSIIAYKTMKAEADRPKTKNFELIPIKKEAITRKLRKSIIGTAKATHKRESIYSENNSNYISLTLATHGSTRLKPNKQSKRVAQILSMISITFAIFNLPYLITWSVFYQNIIFRRVENETVHNYLYAAVELAEIFYVLHYSMLFFLYCFTGSKFRNQLKYLSKFKNLFIILEIPNSKMNNSFIELNYELNLHYKHLNFKLNQTKPSSLISI